MKDTSWRQEFFFLLFLFALSLLVYFSQHRRYDNAYYGQDFLEGVGPSSIAKVVMKKEDGTTLIFKREGEGVVLENSSHYPVYLDRYNDLIFDFLKIQIDTRVSALKESYGKYGVDSSHPKISIELLDSSNKRLEKFYVGEKSKPIGHYIRKEGDETVYRSKGYLNFSFSDEWFLKKTILAVDAKDLDKIIFKNFVIVKKQEQDKELISLEDMGAKDKLNEGELNNFFYNLTTIAFDSVSLENDRELGDLKFIEDYIVFILKNNIRYHFKMAFKDKCTFFKVMMIGDEKSKKQAKEFNDFSRRFIYKLNESKTNFLNKTKDSFLLY